MSCVDPKMLIAPNAIALKPLQNMHVMLYCCLTGSCSQQCLRAVLILRHLLHTDDHQTCQTIVAVALFAQTCDPSAVATCACGCDREEKYAREARAADVAERPLSRPGGPVQLSSKPSVCA